MYALKRAVMENIQSHIHTVLEFPETGIVRFLGDNSNGKSVLVKVLEDVVSNRITRPANRRSIIRRGNSSGELLLERYDGVTLYVKIHVEAAQTYAELSRPDMPVTRRYLADKAIPLLVKDFGWHFDSNHKVSINIHTDTDGLLFVDTDKSTNFDLLNSVRTDQNAEAALTGLEILIKATKQERERFLSQFQSYEMLYNNLPMWNIEEEQDKRDSCLYYANIIDCLEIPPVPDVSITLPPHFISMVPAVPDVKIPVLIPPFTEPAPDLTATFNELIEIRSGICPTCKRPLFGEEGHNHEMVS